MSPTPYRTRPSRPASLAFVALVATGFALVGCSGQEVERDFGLVRDAPDEYTVTTRAPLSMPPDARIAPPTPGADRPQEQSTRTQALETLAPDVALQGANGGPSPGQAALVQDAGTAAAAPPGTGRGELDHPGASFVNELMFWRGGGKPGTLVDTEAEKRRLQQNAALGRSPTDGATPTVKDNSKPGLF